MDIFKKLFKASVRPLVKQLAKRGLDKLEVEVAEWAEKQLDKVKSDEVVNFVLDKVEERIHKVPFLSVVLPDLRNAIDDELIALADKQKSKVVPTELVDKLFAKLETIILKRIDKI